MALCAPWKGKVGGENQFDSKPHMSYNTRVRTVGGDLFVQPQCGGGGVKETEIQMSQRRGVSGAAVC